MFGEGSDEFVVIRKYNENGFTYFNGERDKYFYEYNKQVEQDKELYYQIIDGSTSFPVPKELAIHWQLG